MRYVGATVIDEVGQKFEGHNTGLLLQQWQCLCVNVTENKFIKKRSRI
jgi:hypothetical protein